MWQKKVCPGDWPSAEMGHRGEGQHLPEQKEASQPLTPGGSAATGMPALWTADQEATNTQCGLLPGQYFYTG